MGQKIKVGKRIKREFSLTGDNRTEKQLLNWLYHIKKLSTVNIAEKLGISRYTISSRMKDYNIKMRTPKQGGILASRKYNYRKGLFKKFTPESCYIIGLIVADGHIAEKRKIMLILAEKDKQILDDISEYVLGENNVIHYNNPIQTEQDKEKLIFYNTNYVNQLRSIGVPIGRKTGKEKFIDFGNRILNLAFIRGFFDGDGSVRIYKRNGYNKVKITFTCASKKFLLDLKKYLISLNINIPPGTPYEKIGCHSLEFASVKEAKKFKNLIYNNANLKLERKYNRLSPIEDIV
jgi:intein/homing endonuclease